MENTVDIKEFINYIIKQVKKAEEEWCCFKAQARIEEKTRRARGQQRQQQEKEKS